MGNFPRDGENFPLVARATRVSSRVFLVRNALTIWCGSIRRALPVTCEDEHLPANSALSFRLRVTTPHRPGVESGSLCRVARGADPRPRRDPGVVQPISLLTVARQRALPHQRRQHALTHVGSQIEQSLSLSAGQPEARHLLEFGNDTCEERVACRLMTAFADRRRKGSGGHFVPLHYELPVGTASAVEVCG